MAGKKPPARRKGFDQGGSVGNNRMLSPDNRDMLASSRAGQDVAAMYQGRSNAIRAMSDEAQKRNYAPRPSEDQGKAKGGKVRKVVRRGK